MHLCFAGTYSTDESAYKRFREVLQGFYRGLGFRG